MEVATGSSRCDGDGGRGGSCHGGGGTGSGSGGEGKAAPGGGFVPGAPQEQQLEQLTRMVGELAANQARILRLLEQREQAP